MLFPTSCSTSLSGLSIVHLFHFSYFNTHFILVLICIFLMANDVKCPFICLLEAWCTKYVHESGVPEPGLHSLQSGIPQGMLDCQFWPNHTRIGNNLTIGHPSRNPGLLAPKSGSACGPNPPNCSPCQPNHP